MRPLISLAFAALYVGPKPRMDWVAAQAKRIASNRTTGVALVTRRELQFGAWGLNAECVVRCSLVIDDKSALSDCRCSDSHPYSGGLGISRKPRATSVLAGAANHPMVGSP